MSMLVYLLLAQNEQEPIMIIRKSEVDITAFHTLKDILNILEQSSVVYTFDLVKEVQGCIIDKESITDRMLLQNYVLHVDDDSAAALFIEKPSERINEIWKQAEELLKDYEFDLAIERYQAAIEVEPTFAKSYTFLGNVYFMRGNYTDAEDILLKAIALNPIDYQAYHFLGNTYAAIGDFESAKKYLTYAFMLNKNNPFLKISLERLLKSAGITIREDRMSVPAKFEIESDTSVRLLFQKVGGQNWTPLITTRACWEVESDFRNLLNEDDLLKLSMYKECLVNQAIFTEHSLRENVDISINEKYLYEAIKDGYLNAILYWEIGVSIMPEVILPLPDDLKNEIVEYIKKYVFCSKI